MSWKHTKDDDLSKVWIDRVVRMPHSISDETESIAVICFSRTNNYFG